MAEQITIVGLEETLANLQKLDQQVRGPILKKAVKAGAEIIKAAEIAAAPVGNDAHPGLLRDNIKVKTSSKPSRGIIGATVGIRGVDWSGPAWYGTFVLWGHKAGRRRLGNKRKQVAGNDFMKRATGSDGEAAANAMIAVIADGIEKAQQGT